LGVRATVVFGHKFPQGGVVRQRVDLKDKVRIVIYLLASVDTQLGICVFALVHRGDSTARHECTSVLHCKLAQTAGREPPEIVSSNGLLKVEDMFARRREGWPSLIQPILRYSLRHR
jgi:hypothetical protein